MSSTSIKNDFKDQGYTSPDFLTNLFKKPLYSSSSFSISSIESLSPTTPASPLQNRQALTTIEPKNSPPQFRPSHLSKLTRAHSLTDDDPILKRKFHTFFKAIMQGRLSETETHNIWQKLQDSFNNPFAFDELIDGIRAERQQEAEKIQSAPTIPIERGKERKRAKSIREEKEKTGVEFTSAEKRKEEGKSGDVREYIGKQVRQIKVMVLKGQRQCRNPS